MNVGTNLILEERLRQRAEYSSEHDDEHEHGEIAYSAASLLVSYVNAGPPGDATLAIVQDGLPTVDPWNLAEKFIDQRKRLVIAGALIAAEIDRLERRKS